MNEYQNYPPQGQFPGEASSPWKWIAIILLIPICALTCCCGGGILWLVGGLYNASNTETYNDAVRRAKADPRVQEALGEPLTESLSTQSNYKEVNGKAERSLQIPLRGPKGAATLSVTADNHSGSWKFSELHVRPANGPAIDLRTATEQAAPPPAKVDQPAD